MLMVLADRREIVGVICCVQECTEKGEEGEALIGGEGGRERKMFRVKLFVSRVLLRSVMKE